MVDVALVVAVIFNASIFPETTKYCEFEHSTKLPKLISLHDITVTVYTIYNFLFQIEESNNNVKLPCS